MTGSTTRWSAPDDQPTLLPLETRTVRLLHWTAYLWAFAAMAGLLVASRSGWVDHLPGGDAYEVQQQQIMAIGFLIAIAISWKWEVVGGTIASMTAAAILVFAHNQLVPAHAWVITIVFLVPGALWILIYLHDLRPRTAAVALGLVAVAVVAGGVYAQRTYDSIYGPSHPPSTLASLPESDVEWMWSGGVTPTGAVITARLDGDVERAGLVIGTDPGLDEEPRTIGPIVPADGVVRFTVDGLEPATDYTYGLELDGELETAALGEFTTFPDGAASFTIAVGSCSRVGSNGAVFDAIRELDPLLFVVTGDFHYANIATDDPDAFREVLDFTLEQTAQAALYRSTPIAYVWDDHDYGANNADATTPSRAAAMEVYREYVPHYPLAGDEAPIYQAYSIGRVRVIMTDTRSARSPSAVVDDADKTMLGAEQLAWLKNELLAADDAYPVIIWANSVPWVAPTEAGGDDWGGYATERGEIADFIAEHDIDGLLMVSGDAHMVAIDDGTNSDFSTEQTDGFPVLHAAALDRPGHTKGGPFSEGMYPGGGQFGRVDVIDDGGDTITVELSGHTWDGEELVRYEFTVSDTGR